MLHAAMGQKCWRRPPRDHTLSKDAQTVYDYTNFRFLELPPELRNRIYEYATEYSFRCFPPLFQKLRESSKGAKSPFPDVSNNSTASKRTTIPYLALTQTCAQLRAEFRPMWLTTHKIPLSLVTSYLKAFFPARLPKGMQFKPLTLSTHSLRIFIRNQDLNSGHLCDVTRLFKHKARFPGSVITCDSLPYYDHMVLQELDRFINNSNTAWMQSIKGGRISQVRLGSCTKTTFAADIVVKERFAEPWMKVTWPQTTHHIEPFLRGFGIIPSTTMSKVHVSVDYS